MPIEFEGEYFDEGFRVDLFVEGKVIIELAGSKLGFILNFGAALMKYGIIRTVNGLSE